MKFYISGFSETVEKIQVLLKSDKNDGTSHKNLSAFMIICR